MDRAGGPDHAALEVLADFAPVFADPDCRFATWSDAGTVVDPESIRLSYVELTDVAARFLQTCAEQGWVRPDIDWRAWRGTPDARRLHDDPAALAAATSDDLAHLLTALVRGDRFDEGELLDAFESGLLLRIAERAARLAAEGRATPDA
jgi:hypothetical protein